MFVLIYKVELAVNKILIILSLVLVVSCGQSQEEKRQVEMEQQRIEVERQRLEKEASEELAQEKAVRIAAVTCSIMSETRKMDAAVRVREMNDAREKIGGEPFLGGDDAIIDAFEYGLCKELVLNENYEQALQLAVNKRAERQRIAAEKKAEEQRIAAEKKAEEQRIAAEKKAEEQRIAAEKKAEEQRIAAEKQRIAAEKQRTADSKPTVKGVFYSNGKLRSRTNYKAKIDGGSMHGLRETYYKNGQLESKAYYIDGKWDEDRLIEYYSIDGQLENKLTYKDGQPYLNRKKHGVHIKESWNGSSRARYKNGKLDGLYEWFGQNGQPVRKDCYKDGKKTEMSYCNEK